MQRLGRVISLDRLAPIIKEFIPILSSTQCIQFAGKKTATKPTVTKKKKEDNVKRDRYGNIIDFDQGRSTDIAKFQAFLEPRKIEPVVRTPEELEEARQMALEYNKARRQAHWAWERDLQTKIDLKFAAIDALPDGFLKEEAAKPDYTHPKVTRQIWTHTPPFEVHPSDDDKAKEQRRLEISQKKEKKKKRR
jgi:hypothetical protein